MGDIVYRTITTKDDVSKMLRDFLTDEWIFSHCPFTEEENLIYINRFTEKSFQGFSILAEDSEVRGVMVVTQGHADDSNSYQESNFSLNFNICEELAHHLEGPLTSIAGTENYLIIQIAFVTAAYRKKKLAYQMASRIVQKAKDLNYEALTLIATSEKSINLFLKLGFTIEKEVFYSNHIYPPTGKAEFSHITGEHKRVVVMLKKLK